MLRKFWICFSLSAHDVLIAVKATLAASGCPCCASSSRKICTCAIANNRSKCKHSTRAGAGAVRYSIGWKHNILDTVGAPNSSAFRPLWVELRKCFWHFHLTSKMLNKSWNQPNVLVGRSSSSALNWIQRRDESQSINFGDFFERKAGSLVVGKGAAILNCAR